MISEKQTILQFDQSHKRNNQGLFRSSIRCENQGASYLEYLITLLLKQYVNCKLFFNEGFVIFVDFVLE